MKYIKKLKIPNFIGINKKDTLPKNSSNENKCGIVNLDSIKNSETHWSCWIKNNILCYYFYSFGVEPPLEFEDYMQCDILYSTYQMQKINEIICGHLCLTVLYGLALLNIIFHPILFFHYNK